MDHLYTDDYRVTIDGKAAPVRACTVSAIPFNTVWPGHQRPPAQTEEAGFVSYTAGDKPARFEVSPSKPFSKVVIRPLSKKVDFQVHDNRISFALKPGQYTLELDGSHHALHIFVDPERDFSEFTNCKNLLVFGEGEHDLGVCTLASDTTVLVERGAVVYGAFVAENIRNLNIVGYGIIDGKKLPRTAITEGTYGGTLESDRELEPGAMRIYQSSNIYIEGVTLKDANCWAMTFFACDNIFIKNIKHIGMWRYNSDGIDLCNTKNVVIRDSFFRSFDDVIVPNGRTPWQDINTENLVVDNCVCWCDWGRTLEIGAITIAPEIRNIVYRNCDLIHNMHACMDIQNFFFARVHDVTFEDIRVEYSRDCMQPVYQESDDAVYPLSADTFYPPLFSANITHWMGFTGDLYGENYDIRVRNIHIYAEEGLTFPPVQVFGHSSEYKSHGIIFEDIYFNDVKMDTFEIRTNAFAEDITIR